NVARCFNLRMNSGSLPELGLMISRECPSGTRIKRIVTDFDGSIRDDPSPSVTIRVPPCLSISIIGIVNPRSWKPPEFAIAARVKNPRHNILSLCDQLTQHVRQNAAVLVILNFYSSVYTQFNLHLFSLSVRSLNFEAYILLGLEAAAQSDDVKHLRAIQPEGLCCCPFLELQGQHAHANQIASMNSFKAFRDDSLDAEQTSSFRCPIARASG